MREERTCCPQCGGLRYVLARMPDLHEYWGYVECPTCHGTGRIPAQPKEDTHE